VGFGVPATGLALRDGASVLKFFGSVYDFFFALGFAFFGEPASRAGSAMSAYLKK
jgi:hypothetical protein